MDIDLYWKRKCWSSVKLSKINVKSRKSHCKYIRKMKFERTQVTKFYILLKRPCVLNLREPKHQYRTLYCIPVKMQMMKPKEHAFHLNYVLQSNTYYDNWKSTFFWIVLSLIIWIGKNLFWSYFILSRFNSWKHFNWQEWNLFPDNRERRIVDLTATTRCWVNKNFHWFPVLWRRADCRAISGVGVSENVWVIVDIIRLFWSLLWKTKCSE